VVNYFSIGQPLIGTGTGL